MKHISQRFFAFACSTAVFLPALPITAASAEGTDSYAFPDSYVSALYDDYDPIGQDYLTVSVPEKQSMKIEIVQHSPERENLKLFSIETESTDAEAMYHFRLEPGSYTICLSNSKVRDGGLDASWISDFVIDNADYAAEEDMFFWTEYKLLTKTDTLDDAEKWHAPEIVSDATKNQDSTYRYRETEIVFSQYDRLLGDYDGDQAVTSLDAQKTLEYYAAGLSETSLDTPPTNAQLAAVDIDGDNSISPSDAQEILSMYLELMNAQS
ncbi:MAG: dockerin type I domain-containing protein [Oscillospiraceae bacterium]|nr:dockerin type I domain-containing protein [Oscillospiraceae bacterium]